MIPIAIEDYISAHTSPEPALLGELRRHTHLHTPYPRMISGHVQGRLLSLVSKLVRPRRILEIGTFTGYSAICLSEGLEPDGMIVTIESEEVYADVARVFFDKAGIAGRVIMHRGDALSVIPVLDDTFDLVFIDAAKEQYESYYQLVVDKVRIGGVILADNALWDGKVVDPAAYAEQETAGIMRFNRMVAADPRVEQVLLSVRDGLMMMRRL